MGLKEKAVRGVKWTTASTVFLTLLQILRLAVLTRLLEKSDFGLIAIATMVISFTDIFSELGLTVAVIHKQGITDKQYSSIYWTNVLLSVLVLGILCVCSPLIASFYNEPILSKIVPLLGIQIIFHGFGKMFQTIKAKELEYGFISKTNIFTALIGFTATVILAVAGFGIYSLVIGQLIQVGIAQGIYAIEGWKIHRLTFHLNFREISDFIRIGTYRLGSQILDFVSSKIDIFLIGRFFGMDDLGVYNLGKDLMMRPYSMINMLVNNVASSAFAQLQTDLKAVKDYFLKLLNIISTLAIPVYIAIFIFADAIVSILYGENFAEVAVFLRIFTFVGIECAISSQGSIIQVALGRTDIGFKWTVVRIVLSTAVILAASKMSIYMVAYGQLLVSIASLFIFWAMAVKQIIKAGFLEYVNAFKLSLFVSLLIAVPFFACSSYLKLSIALSIVLIGLYLVLVFVYYWLYKKDFVNSLFSLVKKR